MEISVVAYPISGHHQLTEERYDLTSDNRLMSPIGCRLVEKTTRLAVHNKLIKQVGVHHEQRFSRKPYRLNFS